MPAKRKSSKAAASADHLHPASAAAAASAASQSKPTSGSSSSSSVSTVNGGSSSKPAGAGKPARAARPDPYANSGRTWNPIKLIERALFRTYWNIEATFVLSMLEAWEVFLVIVVVFTLTALLWYSLIHYFPRHAQQVATRALYYVYGNSPPPQLAAAVTANASEAVANTANAAAAQQGVLEKLVASTNQLWANLDPKDAALESNPELVDSLIANLNKLKHAIANKPDL
ncbi:hypothetical protein PaG_05168 [Moesziomyces aphidis]|jgi:hypothetical protein|uniref:Uncharacterized protein n=2 Tax=Moesziomyces TaxID=63261 RepID=M9MDT0_PSEA3|nr:hypothetical protein PaG_05168 [Moesziomyces aphidis]GAC72857.1 hypothetical protein PANT_7d00311 [Moesziomyces antarcticus T-34]